MSYILFGAGDYGIKMLNMIGANNVKCFIDGNPKVESVFGIPVYHSDDISHLHRAGDEIVLCTSKQRYAIEMAEYLKENKLDFRLMQEIGDEIVSKEAQIYNERNHRRTFVAEKKNMWSCPWDRVQNNGEIDAYFWQDLWAAKKVYEASPAFHYDIGSRIDGLIAHLLSFKQKVRVIDIRNMESDIDGLEYICADATKLDVFSEGEIESLSAICSIEHFGLGRYTDAIDPEACFKFMHNIGKKIRDGGSLYISVPIGVERVQFNAHRVFRPSTIVEEMIDLSLVEFSVYEHGRIVMNADLHAWDNCEEYGAIGLFHFRK